MTLLQSLVFLPSLIVGLTVHEFAHAWSASLLGDDFPRRQGRVSLNPLRHLSPLGTLAILFLPFGWGKPVLINLYHFRNPKRDYLITSLAGPLANLLLAGLFLGLAYVVRHTYAVGGEVSHALLKLTYSTLDLGITLNVILAVFNLLPIPPLDGSKIWPCLIPSLHLSAFHKHSRYLMIAFLVFVLAGGTGKILNPILDGVQAYVPISDGERVEQLEADMGVALARKDYVRVRDLADQALAIWPENPAVLCKRALANLRDGRTDAAIQDLDQLEELHLVSSKYNADLEALLVEIQKWEDSESSATSQPAETPDDEPAS